MSWSQWIKSYIIKKRYSKEEVTLLVARAWTAAQDELRQQQQESLKVWIAEQDKLWQT
jgi:predicted DNA-binding protein (MmcQ/YjbR family)